MADPHLITVDELRAAGALDVPAAWRKSLGGKREPSPRLLWDDSEEAADDRPASSAAPGVDSAADEPQ